MSKANKYLVYHDILLAMANSAEYKGSLTEEALLAGAARLMGKYEEEKEEELKTGVNLLKLKSVQVKQQKN